MLKFVAWMPNNSIPEFECKDSQINRYYKEQLQTDIDARAVRRTFYFKTIMLSVFHIVATFY